MNSRSLQWLSCILLVGLGVAAVLAPLLAFDFSENFSLRQSPTTASALHETWSWWLWATRQSLALALSAAAISAVLGLPLGIVSGWNGERGDLGGTGALEFVGRVPSILLVGILRYWDPTEGILALSCTLALLRTMDVIRLVRSHVASRAATGFVIASQALGGSFLWRLKHHTLSGLWRPMCSTLAVGASTSLCLEAALTYVGLGFPERMATWGGGLGTSQVTSKASIFGLVLFSLVASCLALRHLARQWLRPIS